MRPNDSVSRSLSHLLLRLLHLLIILPRPQMAGSYQPEVDDHRIYIAGLFPLTSPNGRENAAGVLPSVKLALDHVNRDRNLLPHHILDLDFNDTQCDMAVGSKVFFDMMHNPPPKVVIFGDACSEVTVPVAETAVWWNVTQLSYADSNPVLSDRTKYPFFFRTVPSDTDFNEARIQMLVSHQWKRVATLFQDASSGSSRHALIHSKLIDLLDKTSIDRETESFSSDPRTALIHIKQKDMRIILGDFDAGMARSVFCAAFELGMYGAKYQWLLAGHYSDNWWRVSDPKVTCSVKDIEQAMDGFIGTDVLSLSTSDEPTFGGLTPRQYLFEYNSRRQHSYSKFHGYAYDGIWVIAKAVDEMIRKSKRRRFGGQTEGRGGGGGGEGVEARGQKGGNGDHNKVRFRSWKFHRILNKINFTGVTGRVVFKKGDRLGSVILEQFQDGKMVSVGQLNTLTKILSFNNKIRWAGGTAPRDGSHKVHQLQTINAVIYASISCLAALGIVLTCCFLAVNIKFRNHRYIKMSSPNMNNVILAGCVLTYCSVFLLGIDGRIVSDRLFPFTCSLKLWVFCLGFTLSFGAMFSKTWRVHSIFTNIKLNKKVIKDYKLILIVNLLLSLDLVILTTWQVLDPPHRETVELSPQSDPEGGDVEYIPYIEFCVSQHRTIFLVAIYVYKGLLLVVGCFLAWETRHVSIAALNDSKYIGMSVYCVVITCVAGVPVTFLVGDRPDAAYVIIALFVIFATTVTLCLVFGPKMIEIRRDPKGEEKKILRTLRQKSLRSDEDSLSTTRQQRITELSYENQCYRELLDARQKEIQLLLRQLGGSLSLEDNTSDSVFQSPIKKRRQSDGSLACQEDDFFRLMNKRNSQQHVTVTPQSRHHSKTPAVGRTPKTTNYIEMMDLSLPSTIFANAYSIKRLHRDLRSDHVDAQPTSVSRDASNDHETSSTVPMIASSSSSFSTRTPSYQGLKFLGDLQLRETDIISDESDAHSTRSNSPNSFNSFQEQEDDSTDATKSLLS